MAVTQIISSVLSRLTPTVLLVLGIFSSGALYVLYLLALPKPFPGIPYEKESAKRILGDIPRLEALRQAGEPPRKLWTLAAAQLGEPMVQVFLGPFRKPALVISDFREVQDLQVRRAKSLRRGWLNVHLWNGLVPHHFIAMEEHDARFKDTKNLGKDLMTPAFLNQVNAPTSHAKVEEFIQLWQKKMQIAGGRPFDGLDDLGGLTYDIMIAASVGVDEESTTSIQLKRLQMGREHLTAPASKDALFMFPKQEEPELLQSMKRVSLAVSQAASFPSPRLFHLFNNRTSSMKRMFHFKDTILTKYLDRASDRLAEEGSNFKPRAAADYLVSREAALAEKDGRKACFNSPILIDNLFGYLNGGQDSTHSTLGFLVKHLGNEQEIQEKLRQALFEAYPEARVKNEQPSLDDILKTKVPYLDAAVEEVLRFSNPAMAIGKETCEDMTILGHHIPANTMLILSTRGPTINHPGARVNESLRSETCQKHRDEGLGDWADSPYPAEEFHPERWLKQPSDSDATDEMVFDPKAGPLLTFSAGPRMCWGRRLAYLELKLVVTLFVWNFVFERLPAELNDWDIDDDMFVKPRHSRVKLSSVPPAGKL